MIEKDDVSIFVRPERFRRPVEDLQRLFISPAKDHAAVYVELEEVRKKLYLAFGVEDT